MDGKLEVGTVATTVEVTGTPMLNQVDATVGYVSISDHSGHAPRHRQFHATAILSPGVNADVLNGSGTNTGLGNQAIWANGQRDTATASRSTA